jgi:methionyl-tRNA formyltransferase
VRIVFFGTPHFAVPTLDTVARAHEVRLVIAQPDKPAGRGMKMQAPAVATRARDLGLPLSQPPRVREATFLETVARLDADIGIVIAYGKILPGALLEIPKHGFLNVHASVLPRWRGAAPIQRAIEAGDRVTGVTIMRVDEQLDHGPMLAIETTDIGPDEHSPSVAARLAAIGADALLRVLRDIEAGRAVETPQEHERATLAAKIDKSEGKVRFVESAHTIYDRFRAFDPWPGVFIESDGEIIKLTSIARGAESGAPRTVLGIDEDVVVAAGDGAIRIIEMQRAGKPRGRAGAIARGLGWRVGQAIP